MATPARQPHTHLSAATWLSWMALGLVLLFSIILAQILSTEPGLTRLAHAAPPTPPATQVDLAVEQSDNPDPATVDSPLTYTVIVSNTGTAASDSLTLTNRLQGVSYTFDSAMTSEGSCAYANNVVTCSLNPLAAGDSVTVAITVVPTAAGTLSNMATVTGGPGDANPANNTNTESTIVEGNTSADLAVTLSDAPDPVGVGWAMTYTIVVRNNGPDTARQVVLSDPLPDTVTFVSADSAAGSCAEMNGTVSCALGSIDSGQTVEVTIVVRTLQVGNIANTVEVAAQEFDPREGNNTASTETSVIGAYLPLVITPSG